MKLRNIIYALVAGASIFASCTKEVKRDSLDVLKVDKTFVSIDKMGGTATLIINATADWHIVDSVVVKNKKESAFPEGLTIEPLVGLRGETKVTFTSPEARKKAAKCQIEIICEGQSQFVLFNMEAGAPSPYPDFKAGKYWLMFQQEDGSWLASKHCTASIDDAGSYGYVSCEPASGEFPDLSSTANNIFTFEAVDGGYIIKDVEGGYLYQDAAGKYNNFYRTSEKGKAMIWSVEQDSETEYYITSTQGKWIQYSTGYSTWGAYNSKQDKALLPYLVEAKDPAPEVLKLESEKVTLEKNDTTFTVKAKINADKVSVDFNADWLNYYGTNEDGLIFKAKANEAGARSAAVKISATLKQGEKEFTNEVTLTVEQEGSVLEVSVADFLAAEVGSTQYKLSGFVTDRTDISGHKFDLANYGNFDITDATGNAYVYGVGAKGDIATYGVKEGDIITLVGLRAEYKGSAQMGSAQYESHKSVTVATAAEVNAMTDEADPKNPQNYVRVTGKVTNGTATPGHKFDLATYGNFDLVDESGSLYVYGVSTGWNGETKKFGTLGVKEGDIITLVGYKTSYNGTNELVGMYISHEEDQPEPEEGLVHTSWYIYSSGEPMYLLTFPDETNCSMAGYNGTEWVFDDPDYSGYNGTYSYDPVSNNGTISMMETELLLYKNAEGQLVLDGSSMGWSPMLFEQGEYIEKPNKNSEVTIDLTAQGYENAQEVTVVEKDGITVTFDKGTNNNAPKYYTAGNAVRVYGSNTVTVSGTKAITEISFEFGSGEGSNEITANTGSFDGAKWTGSAASVTFTVGGTSGHRRFAKIIVK